MEGLRIAEEVSDGTARVLCARCYSLTHYGCAHACLRSKYTSVSCSLGFSGLTLPCGIIRTAELGIRSQQLHGPPFTVFMSSFLGQLSVMEEENLLIPHWGVWCRQIKSAMAEAALPEFDLAKRVGRKLALQRFRRSVVLCVVDAADFDGSLPRNALRALLPAAVRPCAI